MEIPEMENDFDSEGTISDEDLEEPVKNVTMDFFQEYDDNTTELFRKYFKAIKKNRYILSLIDDVLKERCVCYAYTNFERDETKSFHKDYPLPSLSGGPQEGNPGASKNIKMTQTIKKGRGMEAVADIRAGETVIVEKAIALGLMSNCRCTSFANLTCYHCTNPMFKFVPCENCDVCLFCDEKCLTEAWESYHQFECYGVQRHFWYDKFSHTALRMMLACMNKTSNESTADCIEKFDILQNLETHLGDYSVEDLNFILENSARTLIYLIERTNFFQKMMLIRGKTVCKPYYMYMFTGGLLVRFHCAAKVAAVTIQNRSVVSKIGYYQPQFVALAVSKNATLINHSCNPNCIVLNNKNYVIIRAVRDIKPSEELTICYHPITYHMRTKDRAYFCNTYFFSCECEYCLTPDEERQYLNTFVCRFCEIGRVLCNDLNETAVCVDCDRQVNYKVLKKLDNAAAKQIHEFQNLNTMSAALDTLEAFDVFYPLSFNFYSCYQLLYKFFIKFEDTYFKGCDIGIESIEILIYHTGYNSLEYHYVMYNTILDMVNSEYFTKLQWTENKLTLQFFRNDLESAYGYLSCYYEEEQIKFIKEGLERVIDMIVKIGGL